MSKINIWSWHGLPWNGLRPRDRANENSTNLFMVFWVVSLAVIRIPVLFSMRPEWISWALGAVSLWCGWLFVRAYLRMLRQADELLRMVQLEALAAGCGAALICGLTYAATATPGPEMIFAFFLPLSVAYLGRILLAAHRATKDTSGDTE